MSLIFGRIERDGRPINRQNFVASVETLPGFDANALDLRFGDGFALAECNSNTAPRAPDRPLNTQEGEFILVADAIVDDRATLLQSLGYSLCDGASISDRDLLRSAYLRWGECCPNNVLGDYAFAAYHPSRRRLLLARDHIGARPLYFAVRGSTILFSTSIAPLVGEKEFSWPLSEERVAHRLCFPESPGTGTFFRDVEVVPPGGLVVFRDDAQLASIWWKPKIGSSSSFRNTEDCVQHGRTLLRQSIEDRIACTGPVAAHCSGGIDSTAISVLAHRSLSAKGSALAAAYMWAPARSADSPDFGFKDERRRMEAVARSEGFALRNGGEQDMLALLERSMELEGETDLADEVSILNQASRDGTKIILSGWGGDEAFSAHGYGYLCNLLLSGRWARAHRFALNQTRSLRNWSTLRSLAWQQVILPLCPAAIQASQFPSQHLPHGHCFIATSFARQHRDTIANQLRRLKISPDPIRTLYTFIKSGHLAIRMQSWAERGAAEGVQYRYPLTDRRILEYILSLPPEIVFLGDHPRGLALAVLKDDVPDYLGKHDPANEAMRAKAMSKAWHGLAEQSRIGRFDRDCPWLDMVAFRRNLNLPKTVDGSDAMLAFWEVFEATRVYRMFARQEWSGVTEARSPNAVTA